jgi:hypothetical protein
MVMWTRLRLLATRLSDCSEMPALAASDMIATSLSPSWKHCFSIKLLVLLFSGMAV